MGTGIIVECKKCLYSQRFNLGIGMMYYDLRAVLSVVKGPKHRTIIKELLNTHPSAEQDYKHCIYSCPKCRKLYERFYVKVCEGSDLLYQIEYHCPQCKTILKQIPDELITQQFCPECREKSLSVNEELCWD